MGGSYFGKSNSIGLMVRRYLKEEEYYNIMLLLFQMTVPVFYLFSLLSFWFYRYF